MTRTDPTADKDLLVQVGDVIVAGHGDQSNVVTIAWTNRAYTPGARDAQGTPHEAPSSRATPVDAICLLAPRGDGQFSGTAMRQDFLTYLGFLEFTESEIDAAEAAGDEFTARDGHTWRVNVPGYRHVDPMWWATFMRGAVKAADHPDAHPPRPGGLTMARITHELTDTEIACGVTLEQVAELRPKVLVKGERVVLPQNTPPALATSVARCALGAPAEYVGHNQLGLPVYRRTTG